MFYQSFADSIFATDLTERVQEAEQIREDADGYTRAYVLLTISVSYRMYLESQISGLQSETYLINIKLTAETTNELRVIAERPP